MNRIQMLLQHAVPSVLGLARLAVSTPVFTAKLFVMRTFFFLARRLPFNLRDPHGFPINSHYALISYWDFFVERALQDEAWMSGFRREPNPVAIDVGANAGTFSYLLTRLNTGAEIYSFEPLPDLERSLREVEKISGNTFHIYNAACGQERGKAVLWANDSGDTDARLAAVGKAGKKRSFDVEVLPLDDVIQAKEIFLLKIDTQGFEVGVLKGAHNILERTRYIIIEVCSADELARVQAALGKKWHGRSLSACDFLFSRI